MGSALRVSRRTPPKPPLQVWRSTVNAGPRRIRGPGQGCATTLLHRCRCGQPHRNTTCAAAGPAEYRMRVNMGRQQRAVGLGARGVWIAQMPTSPRVLPQTPMPSSPPARPRAGRGPNPSDCRCSKGHQDHPAPLQARPTATQALPTLLRRALAWVRAGGQGVPAIPQSHPSACDVMPEEHSRGGPGINGGQDCGLNTTPCHQHQTETMSLDSISLCVKRSQARLAALWRHNL